MSAALKLLELDSACAVCGTRSTDLQQIDSLDADVPHGDTSLQTKLAALSNNKTVSGLICTGCVQRATDAWTFQQQLQASQAEPSLSDKIRVLRQRLRELTQKIDVFIVIGPEKNDGQPVYTEDNIIMVDKNMLGDAEEEDEDMIRNEAGERVYQCSMCPDSFRKLSDHIDHRRTHAPDTLHTCWTCGKQFQQFQAYKAHRTLHAKNDNLTCKLCFTLFQGVVEMRNHSCEPRCPSCSQVFADRSTLVDHVRSEHDTSGSPPYVCAVCMETFDHASKLMAHAVTHRQTKQYVCGYEGCVQRFTTRDALMVHVRKAHPVAEVTAAVACSICGESFTNRTALQKHMTTHEQHPKPPVAKRGRPKKVKTELVEYQVLDAAEAAVAGLADVAEQQDGEEVYGDVEHHTVLIEQDGLPEGEYQLECVEGDEMAVEMLEEEVEYLEVETLEEEIEEDHKPDLAGL